MNSTLQQFAKVIDEASTCIYFSYFTTFCHVFTLTCYPVAFRLEVQKWLSFDDVELLLQYKLRVT